MLLKNLNLTAVKKRALKAKDGDSLSVLASQEDVPLLVAAVEDLMRQHEQEIAQIFEAIPYEIRSWADDDLVSCIKRLAASKQKES